MVFVTIVGGGGAEQGLEFGQMIVFHGMEQGEVPLGLILGMVVARVRKKATAKRAKRMRSQDQADIVKGLSISVSLTVECLGPLCEGFYHGLDVMVIEGIQMQPAGRGQMLPPAWCRAHPGGLDEQFGGAGRQLRMGRNRCLIQIHHSCRRAQNADQGHGRGRRVVLDEGQRILLHHIVCHPRRGLGVVEIQLPRHGRLPGRRRGNGPWCG